MGFGVLEAIAGAYLLDVDLDLGAEVDRAFAYRIGEIVEGVSGVDVKMTFDPPWSPDRMSEEAQVAVGWY